LKLPNLLAGLLMLFVFQGVMSGLRFLTPFLLERQAGVTPITSGFIFLSYPLGFLLLSAWSGRQADNYSPKRLMLFAACLSLSACLLYVLFLDAWGVWHFSVFLLLLGAATGLFTPPNNVATLRGLSDSDIQVASTLIPISLNASLMFGTFSFGLLFKEHDPSLVLMTSIAAFAGIVLAITLRSS
jgi:predicted MFS family arabinose efflux permease